MASRKRGQEKERASRAALMAKMISWFDGYVALYTVDPAKIERSLKGFEGTDIGQIWKRVKSDVNKIVDLPERSEKVESSVRLASRARRLSIFMTIFTFIFLTLFLIFRNQIIVLAGGTDIGLIVPGVLIGVLYLILMINVLSTRNLNRVMRNFYVEHASQVARETTHLRETTQLLIEKLRNEIYSHNLESGRFEFTLYHTNYKNITVHGKHGARFVSSITDRTQQRAHADTK